MQNIITKNHSILKAFDKDTNSPNLKEMQCFCMHVKDFLPFSNFSPTQKLPKKYISYFEMCTEDGG